MVTLHIEHAITDFETWAGAFARFSEARRSAGVRAQSVQRPVDDDRFVVIDLDFDDVDAAVAFRDFLQTVIWSTPESSPGLSGTPRTVLLRSEPQ